MWVGFDGFECLWSFYTLKYVFSYIYIVLYSLYILHVDIQLKCTFNYIYY